MAATISTVAHTIQLSIAPVFLLAGLAGLLNVVAHRLARVVDRVRRLESDVAGQAVHLGAKELKEFAILDRRMRLCHVAIALATAAALLICLVVMLLFIADIIAINLGMTVSLLFIAAMVSLTLGLLLFLAEVTIATRSVRVSDAYLARRTRG